MNKMITPFFQNNSKAVMITNRYMKNNDKKIYHLVDNFKMTSHGYTDCLRVHVCGILKWCKSEAMKCLSKEKSKPQEENIQQKNFKFKPKNKKFKIFQQKTSNFD
ncbi:hypothetical protein RFI_32246 [Reticulomyxa filosa]|uniref:Uncharacterized protein n=1 Tax=Reticulomyxa filosa TaxID=46433 RepID=X6LUT3_RETFI|nr:hypothetical protein RFI_32246 [Reticulomyxa filosa]|eukprot:ETO05151.1 hypothetical protein RFI_32246 [Reticulomyxa filosa]